MSETFCLIDIFAMHYGMDIIDIFMIMVKSKIKYALFQDNFEKDFMDIKLL